MAWDDTRSAVISSCGTLLEPRGYKLVKARDAFERSSTSERRGVYIMLVSTKHGNYKLRVWCGVRNKDIEERFHKTSGVDKKYQPSYTTINLDCGEYWSLNTEEEIAHAVANAKAFIDERAIPFLEENYSINDYCSLLNTNPSGKCPFHGNPENRCHYGLIAAKLAADPRYDELKATYTKFLMLTNNGFYYPRFQRLIADIES